LQTAFIDEQAGQCGYCLPGILVCAKALLDRNPSPSRLQIAEALDDNICRCGSHVRILRAVERATGQSASYGVAALVTSRTDVRRDAAAQAQAAHVVALLSKQPGFQRALDYPGTHLPVLVSRNGHETLVLAAFANRARSTAAVEHVRPQLAGTNVRLGGNDVAFDAGITKRWLPVNSYIGGNEHAVLHLLYSRFITMVLHDAGLLGFEEPFTRFRAHGTIVRDGAKMSKSRGNVVNPDEYVERWGADSFRTYLMFLGPYEEGGDFRDQSISGVRRFLDRLWASVHAARRDGDPDPVVMRKLHQTIQKVTDDIPTLSYNTAVAAMMEYVNVLRAHERLPHLRETEPLVQLVAPFAPHVAEELWETLGHARSVFDSGWPAFDAALAAEDSITVAVQVNGKTRGTVQVAVDADEAGVLQAALAEPNIAKFVTGSPRKVIYVKNRLLNLVV